MKRCLDLIVFNRRDDQLSADPERGEPVAGRAQSAAGRAGRGREPPRRRPRVARRLRRGPGVPSVHLHRADSTEAQPRHGHRFREVGGSGLRCMWIALSPSSQHQIQSGPRRLSLLP